MIAKQARSGTKPQHQTTPLAFDTCIVIQNPTSTESTRAMQYAEGLRKIIPAGIIVISTSPDGQQANRDLIVANADKLGPQTLIAIAGGDGTVNLVVDTLLHDPRLTAKMRLTTILPLWGGNGNDLACMLNGSARRTFITQGMPTGQRIPVYPLLCELSQENKTTVRTAICYASFGASALAAHRLESLRGVRTFFARGFLKFLYELNMVIRTMVGAPRFTIRDGKQTQTIYDKLFINGSRFAKVNEVPLKLTERRFFHVVVEQKRVSSMVFHITELTRRHPDNYAVADGRPVTFTLEEPTWAQIDGEVMRLSEGTSIRVRLSEQPFYAFSTLLHES